VGRDAGFKTRSRARDYAQPPATEELMLRKALWTALYAGLGAVATIASRRVASKLWRVGTGEEPPTKK
jgi:hypothetical protein